MKNIKKILPYIFIFLMILVWTLIILPTNQDEMWNYGFSYNIFSGLIPYKDFNMVVTPLYPFIISIFFHVLGSNIIILHIVHDLILVLTIYFLFKMLKEKAWIIVLLIFLFCKFLPNYNWLLLFLYVLLLYLEEKEDKGLLIGIVLGLLILTKQSVGICMLLPTLLYIRKKEKLKNIILGVGIPIFIFLIYLLLTNSLNYFIDLCILGLFDFAETNTNLFNSATIIFIIIFLITLYITIKDPKDIKNYYTLSFFSIIIPLFSHYHLQFCIIAFIILILLQNKKININISYKWISICTIIVLSLLCTKLFLPEKIIYPNDINNFQYRRLSKDEINFTKKVNKFIKENKNKKIIFINSNAYYFKMVNNMKIEYLDLINMGNWGYNGSEKLLKEIKKNKDALFLVNKNELKPLFQTDRKAFSYIFKNGKKIKEVGIYDIYIIKE